MFQPTPPTHALCIAMPLTSRQPQAAAWRRDAVFLISGPLVAGLVGASVVPWDRDDEPLIDIPDVETLSRSS
jgi:hypothetical protein